MGYVHVSICRRTKNKRGWASGSIPIYDRKELSNVLSVFDKSHENIIWLKLSMRLLKAQMNIYIAGVHNVHNSLKNSSYTKHNEFNIIFDQLSKVISILADPSRSSWEMHNIHVILKV